MTLYRCLYPCSRSFDAEWKLVQHYKKVKACKTRWRRHEDAAVTLAFHQASQRRRSQLRESTLQLPEGRDHGNSSDLDSHPSAFGDHEQDPAAPFSFNPMQLDPESESEANTTLVLSSSAITAQDTSSTLYVPPPSLDLQPLASTMDQSATLVSIENDQILKSMADQPLVEENLSHSPSPFDTIDQPINDETVGHSELPDSPHNLSPTEENLLFLQLLPFCGVVFEDDVDLDETDGSKEFEAALFGVPRLSEDMMESHPLLLEADDFPELNEDGAPVDDTPPLALATDLPTGEQPEDDATEEAQEDDAEIELFERAGEVKRRVKPYFQQVVDERCQKRHRGLFHPFKNAKEFGVVKFLNSLPLARVDEFLHLEYTRKHDDLSFGSGKTMREYLKQLPQPQMKWKSAEITPGSGTTSSPVYLMYRDPIAVIRSLMARPSLAKHFTYQPRRCWPDKSQGKRRYSEIFTGDWAWKTQASLPVGSTLLPILLGSDKAHLTDFSGNKSAWPVYMSLGNIDSSIRNKPSHGCWILIAYIPIPVFTDPKEFHTSLHARLFHQCLSIILKPLAVAGEVGVDIPDSNGDIRHCFTRIAAYLADYPEQILINATAWWESPVTTAKFADLGDSQPHPRRTKEWILSQIARAREEADPSNIAEYLAAARRLGLNAVDEPFWRDHIGYEPDLVLGPDNLHGLFRFWRDHILQWVDDLIGHKELEDRLKALQPITGLRHFTNGLKYKSQWTGREDRELQRYLLAVSAGAPKIDSQALRCLRAIHSFIYFAQYRSHSTTTLGYLQRCLNTFHSLKNVFIRNGARKGTKKAPPHFCIPKLAGLFQYIYHVPRMGSSLQFSTEVTENCHQIYAKAAYRSTNRRDFFKQMCAFLNRRETLSLVEEISHFYQTQRLASSDRHSSDLATFAARTKQNAEKELRLVARRQQRANMGYLWLTIKPDHRGLFVDAVTVLYQLPTFRTILQQYIAQHSHSDAFNVDSIKLAVWYRCRVQRPTIQDDDELADQRTIQAIPPNATNPHGLCNCVLINPNPDEELPYTGISGYHIAQLRMVFQVHVPSTHPLHETPLAFVYWFSEPRSRAEPDINMYKVRYLRGPSGHRVGGIVPLHLIHRLIQLIPVFGAQIDSRLTEKNSMDIAGEYYVNSFMEKEVFQAVW